MSARFEEQMIELMRDVFEAQMNPQPILDVVIPDQTPETDNSPKYAVTVASQSKGTKTYTADNLSTARERNLQLLSVALNDLMSCDDDDKRSQIREFIHAIVNVI